MAMYSFNQFLKKLPEMHGQSLFLFHGPETFFIDQLLEKTTFATFKNPSEREFNYFKFYGTENSASEILAACTSYPMLAEQKLVIVREFDRLKLNKEEIERFKKYIEEPLKSTCLILTAQKLDNKALSKKIQQKAISVACKSLSPGELYAWVTQKYASAGIEVDRETISFLVENIGNDLLRLNQEIEKSIDFSGNANVVTQDLIADLTGFNREVNVFNFQKALGLRNLEQSLKIGLQLLEQQNAVELILTMVYRFFRHIVIIKDQILKGVSKSEIIKKLQQKEFALRDAFASIENFTIEELIIIFDKIYEADIKLKSSEQKKESIVTLLCYHICYTNKGKYN